MRITVCETPHDPDAVEAFWSDLCVHCRTERSDLLVLPEFAFLPAVWESEIFDEARWNEIEHNAAAWLARLGELGCAFVIGAMPTTVAGTRLNQGFLWSDVAGLTPLRSKRHLPNEPGGWEARWFARGSDEFPVYAAGALRFGLNICTELWALETCGAYANAGAHAIVTPRATAAATTERWMDLARTAAVRAGAFSLSSNRRHADGSCGGIGWIIDPEGNELARTSASCRAITVDIVLAESERAQSRYPRYVFAENLSRG
jgi:N-carbamoylputrescine amidase